MSRALRLTPRAPDLVKAILAGRQPAGVTLEALLRPLPAEGKEQRAILVPKE